MPESLRKLMLGAAVPVLILIIWVLSADKSVVVPTVSQVLRVLSHPFSQPVSLDAQSIAHSTLVSVLRVAIGLGMAVITAIPLGILAGRQRWLEQLLSPITTLMMAVSPIAWMPIAIVIFGLSSPATMIAGRDAWRYGILNELRWATVLVIYAGAMFPIMFNTIDGVKRVRIGHLETAKLFGASSGQIFTKIIIPSAMPSIVLGLRMGVAIAWRVIIAAELFPATRCGLGYMIATAHQQAAYEYAFAAVIVIAAIGLSLELSLRWASAKAGHWQVR